MTQTDPTASKRRRDGVLVASLVTGSSRRETAEAAGCSVRTVGRRLADKGFRRALNDARRALFDEVLGRTVHHATRSADVLAAIRDNPETKAAVRVTAARVLLDAALRYRELSELVERIERLEELIEGTSR